MFVIIKKKVVSKSTLCFYIFIDNQPHSIMKNNNKHYPALISLFLSLDTRGYTKTKIIIPYEK